MAPEGAPSVPATPKQSFAPLEPSGGPMGADVAPFKAGDMAPLLKTNATRDVNPMAFDPNDAAAFGELMAQRGPERDSTGLTDDELRSYGINPDTHIAYRCRNPRLWSEAEKSDRLAAFLRAAPGRIAARDADGNLVCETDTVLVAYSKAEAKWLAEQQKAENAQDRSLAQRGDVPQAPAWRGDPGRAAAADAHERHRQDGTIGPTAGRNYTDVIAERIRRGQTDSLEIEQRRFAGIHGRPSQQFATQADADKAAQEAGRNAQISAGRRTFSMGASIKDGKVVK